MLCVICNNEFERAKESKRKTCSRSCAVVLAWQNPAAKKRRIESIRLERSRPEAKERVRLHNARMWSDPAQHERLSNWNRQRWADPEIKAELSKSIRVRMAIPETKLRYANARRKAWQNPDIRKRMLIGMRRAQANPEVRAKMSKEARRRWCDPVLRPKYLKAVRATAAKYKGVRRKLRIVEMPAPVVRGKLTQVQLKAEREAARVRSVRRHQAGKKLRSMTRDEARTLVQKAKVVVKRYPPGVSLGWKPSWMD